MVSPLLALGIILGIILAILIYKHKKKLWLALVAFLITAFGIGTPLHCIIIPSLIGIYFNKLLYKWVKRNWLAFLASLPGILLIVLLLQGTGRLYLKLHVEGPVGLGEGLGVGIAMALIYGLFVMAGIVSYVIASLVSSITRWVRNRKDSL